MGANGIRSAQRIVMGLPTLSVVKPLVFPLGFKGLPATLVFTDSLGEIKGHFLPSRIGLKKR